NLSLAQKARELQAAMQAIQQEARGIAPTAGESMVQSQYPRQMQALPMRMPKNPNPIQVAGQLPGEAPPLLEAEIAQPGSYSGKAAPQLGYSETTGPRLSEAAALNVKPPTAPTTPGTPPPELKGKVFERAPGQQGLFSGTVAAPAERTPVV